MSQTCPISFKQVNEKVARINAMLTATSVVLYLLLSYKFIMVFLIIDFIIRGFFDPRYSLFSTISKSVLRLFNSKPVFIDASPKVFAAKLGFTFTSLMLFFDVFDLQIVSIVIGSVLISFALLEGLFRYCVGCKIYSFFERYKKTQRN